jgi:hypothetical protein
MSTILKIYKNFKGFKKDTQSPKNTSSDLFQTNFKNTNFNKKQQKHHTFQQYQTPNEHDTKQQTLFSHL